MLTFDKVNVITVAKVGSANFLNCDYNQTKKKSHGHSLLKLRNILKYDSNSLIIVGIRNPIDRNLSYLFQTYSDNYHNDVKMKKNMYKGENCFIPELNNNIESISLDKLINLYFNQGYHDTFNHWFREFLEITNIKKFNKKKGLSIYNFPNNNIIIIYTLEKLNKNEKYICDLLGITNFKNSNDSEYRIYKNVV